MAKNRYIAAGMELANRQRELGELLDTPEETRSADFDEQLGKGKAAVHSAQRDVELAALAEPDVPEHRQSTPAGMELRGLIDGSNAGEFMDNGAVPFGVPTGKLAELQQHLGPERQPVAPGATGAPGHAADGNTGSHPGPWRWQRPDESATDPQLCLPARCRGLPWYR